MDIYNLMLEKLNLDPAMIVLVFCSGWIQKEYGLLLPSLKDSEKDGALKTLLLSFFLSGIYVWLVRDELFSRIELARYFLSFVVATVLYRYLGKGALDKLLRKNKE